MCIYCCSSFFLPCGVTICTSQLKRYVWCTSMHSGRWAVPGPEFLLTSWQSLSSEENGATRYTVTKCYKSFSEWVNNSNTLLWTLRIQSEPFYDTLNDPLQAIPEFLSDFRCIFVDQNLACILHFICRNLQGGITSTKGFFFRHCAFNVLGNCTCVCSCDWLSFCSDSKLLGTGMEIDL